MRKKRRKRQVDSREEEEDEFYEDNDDFWDFYPNGVNETKSDPLRIDFAKYGQVSKPNSHPIITSLPESIYCDLVTTLPTKCSQECIF